ncbi:hypothetical protein WQ54_23835 [Bacillus sp. SA1-12]|uniref:hypothetical protein n=1 Tax=Bacillus sp. SA1-12 TaxID=1455638 RepID=UPI0006271E94|nr:hypothetical protein [Bacillus sp. SA1-12]KKI90132.1 hypothetical protein WQ54_23835 [Bacillus sp. SA1-12]
MLSKEVIHSFNLKGKIEQLSGGQNTSLKVDHAVLKPVEDVHHYEWLLSVLNNIIPKSYRLSKPFRSQEGTFVNEGWICTRFEQGKEVNGRIEEKLKVAKLFHQDLSTVDYSDFPHVENPWTKAHRIAWQKDELPMDIHPKTEDIIMELLKKVQLKNQYNVQIVHADLSGNILFDEVLPPLIIDFSPTIAPIEYAEAILVCDCIAWQKSKISELELLPNNNTYREMMIRAVLFRLAVEAIFSKNELNRFMEQYLVFKPIIDYIDNGHYW